MGRFGHFIHKGKRYTVNSTTRSYRDAQETRINMERQGYKAVIKYDSDYGDFQIGIRKER